eukprot:gene17881-biopygen5152
MPIYISAGPGSRVGFLAKEPWKSQNMGIRGDPAKNTNGRQRTPDDQWAPLPGSTRVRVPRTCSNFISRPTFQGSIMICNSAFELRPFVPQAVRMTATLDLNRQVARAKLGNDNHAGVDHSIWARLQILCRFPATEYREAADAWGFLTKCYQKGPAADVAPVTLVDRNGTNVGDFVRDTAPAAVALAADGQG